MLNGKHEHVLKQHGYTHKKGGNDPVDVVSKHSELTGLDADDHPQYIQKSGGAMAGLLTLSGNPTFSLHAATKEYVDNAVAQIGWEIVTI